MQFLRERRCDHAQGFYLAHPMPVPQITELLASRRGADSLERLRDVG
jgi:EAL domain-containing protein (putative c-di-GMP-specific phosphodiesterase class I)